jgi:Fe-S-cluster-containing hydrogenase component 2
MKDWESRGYLDESQVDLPPPERRAGGPFAVIECPQQIPCDPCEVSCPRKAIHLDSLNSVPQIDWDKCNGCGICIQKCPGLAIFVLQLRKDKGRVTLPYEFCPLPERGESVLVLDRVGEVVGEGKIVSLIPREKSRGNTSIVTVEVEPELLNVVRNIRRRENER